MGRSFARGADRHVRGLGGGGRRQPGGRVRRLEVARTLS